MGDLVMVDLSDGVFRGDSLTHRTNQMKLFTAIAAAAVIGTSLITANPVQASYQWPVKSFYPPRAQTVSTRNQIPKFPLSLPEFVRVPGRDFWNKPINERGQVRTFGNESWQTINQFPNTMNGCHNGVFLLRWRSANGPVMSAVGWSTRKADFKASNPASYGFMYGTNCQMPLFKSVEKSRINNVIYDVFYYQAGV